jgi:8-oxo-dGTP pyrophosphatase MutT (NUDIX family)
VAERILSAGVVVVRRDDAGWRVLLLRVYNYWDCPKGLVEPGEDPLVTARREVLEETSIDDLEFRWGEEFVETAPYAKNKVARYYLAATGRREVRLPISAELGRAEHHEYRWLDFDAAAKLVGERIAAVLRWAEDRITG